MATDSAGSSVVQGPRGAGLQPFQKPQSIDTKDLGEPEIKTAVVKSCGDFDMIKDFNKVAAGSDLDRAICRPSDRAERKADSVKADSRYLPGE